MTETGYDDIIARHVRSGDTVLIGQATSEPAGLVRALLRRGAELDSLTLVCGYALDSSWSTAAHSNVHVVSYAAHGALRPLARSGHLAVLPIQYSGFEKMIEQGRLAADVVCLQIPDGGESLGLTVDHTVSAARRARSVLVERNHNLPRGRTSTCLPSGLITESVSTGRALPVSPAREPWPAEDQIARRVAELVPDGAAIQLGVGALATAVAASLSGHRGLRVRSGLVGDWIVDLSRSGALADVDPCITGIALGTERLYDHVRQGADIELMSAGELLNPARVAPLDPFVAVNSAFEVDLLGQAGAEVAGSRYLGAVGGQVDFFRATRLARTGLAIVAVTSTNPDGTSRIVPALSGPTTCLQSDVDLVITEHGVADLRTGYRERVDRLIAVADPVHRADLQAAARRLTWISARTWARSGA